MTLTFFVLLPSQPLKFWSVADLVQEVERLEAAYVDLEQATASHAVIDQAMGVVVAFGQIPPEEAWRVLRDVSQHTNTKLRVVAEDVLKFAQGTPLTKGERAELQRAVIRYGGTPRGPLR
ncbi:antitermination regulator [Streptomyces sp. WAC 06738]|uniref:ANTAR domain-containing protein n=1 Tax=Streptomyces sp. WAC 06738 TaxID=2203210 RepID=UPI000F718CD7|nr:ANTAR domain-containing protein [Streptomyces sp. WAC 06738]AZM47842.1 antitermination regulator [Streptomyces sp. WAC 06738]